MKSTCWMAIIKYFNHSQLSNEKFNTFTICLEQKFQCGNICHNKHVTLRSLKNLVTKQLTNITIHCSKNTSILGVRKKFGYPSPIKNQTIPFFNA